MTAPHTPGHGHDPHAKNKHDGHGHHDDHGHAGPQDPDDNEFTRPRDLDAADEHPHAHLEDLTYLEKDKLLFKENLGFQYYNEDHKKAGREVGDKKWDDYVKALNDIFARYNNGIDGLEKDKQKYLETKPPKPTNVLEQKLDNQVREAIREGWTQKDYVLYVNGVHYDLYRFGLGGLKKLRDQLAENADAVQKIDRFAKLKKAALVRAVQGAVGNILETYGWRHPTEKEHEHIETFKKLIDNEKTDLLIAEIKDLAIEAGIALEHIIAVLDKGNLVQILKKDKVTDDQIKKTALEKLRKLNEETHWERFKNKASDALAYVFRTSDENVRRADAEKAGIPFEESEGLRALVIEYDKNPASTDLANTIKARAETGSEPEKWLFVEEFVETNGEIKRDVDLTPKARTYKKMLTGWGVDFKSFTQILPRRTPKPKPHAGQHAEHHATELTAAQKQFAQEIILLFKIGHHDEIIKRCLKSFSNFLYDLVGDPNSVAAKEVATIFAASVPHGNYHEFIATLPSRQNQAKVQRMLNEAEHDTRHKKNREAVDLAIDFLAKKELPSAKSKLNHWIKANKDSISSQMFEIINNLTKPPAEPTPPTSPVPTKTPDSSTVVAPVEPRHLTLVPNPDLIAAEKTIESKLAEQASKIEPLKNTAPSAKAYNSLKEAEDDIARALALKNLPATLEPPSPAASETSRPRVDTANTASFFVTDEDIEDEETIAQTKPTPPIAPPAPGAKSEPVPQNIETSPLPTDTTTTPAAANSDPATTPTPEAKKTIYSKEKIADELVRADIFLTADTPKEEKEKLLASDTITAIQKTSGRSLKDFENNLPTAGKYLAKKFEIMANKFKRALAPETLTNPEFAEKLKSALWERTRIEGAKNLSEAQNKFDTAMAELETLGALLKPAESAPAQERITNIESKGNVDNELWRNDVPGMLSDNGYTIAAEAITTSDGNNIHDQELSRQLLFVLAGKDKDDFGLLTDYATLHKDKFSKNLQKKLELIIKETKAEILS